jgi:hypothetical protein
MNAEAKVEAKAPAPESGPHLAEEDERHPPRLPLKAPCTSLRMSEKSKSFMVGPQNGCMLLIAGRTIL